MLLPRAPRRSKQHRPNQQQQPTYQTKEQVNTAFAAYLLKHFPLLGALTSSSIHALIASVSYVSHSRGEYLAHQNHAFTHLHFIAYGTINVISTQQLTPFATDDALLRPAPITHNFTLAHSSVGDCVGMESLLAAVNARSALAAAAGGGGAAPSSPHSDYSYMVSSHTLCAFVVPLSLFMHYASPLLDALIMPVLDVMEFRQQQLQLHIQQAKQRLPKHTSLAPSTWKKNINTSNSSTQLSSPLSLSPSCSSSSPLTRVSSCDPPTCSLGLHDLRAFKPHPITLSSFSASSSSSSPDLSTMNTSEFESYLRSEFDRLTLLGVSIEAPPILSAGISAQTSFEQWSLYLHYLEQYRNKLIVQQQQQHVEQHDFHAMVSSLVHEYKSSSENIQNRPVTGQAQAEREKELKIIREKQREKMRERELSRRITINVEDTSESILLDSSAAASTAMASSSPLTLPSSPTPIPSSTSSSLPSSPPSLPLSPSLFPSSLSPFLSAAHPFAPPSPALKSAASPSGASRPSSRAATNRNTPVQKSPKLSSTSPHSSRRNTPQQANRRLPASATASKHASDAGTSLLRSRSSSRKDNENISLFRSLGQSSSMHANAESPSLFKPMFSDVPSDSTLQLPASPTKSSRRSTAAKSQHETLSRRSTAAMSEINSLQQIINSVSKDSRQSSIGTKSLEIKSPVAARSTADDQLHNQTQENDDHDGNTQQSSDDENETDESDSAPEDDVSPTATSKASQLTTMELVLRAQAQMTFRALQKRRQRKLDTVQRMKTRKVKMGGNKHFSHGLNTLMFGSSIREKRARINTEAAYQFHIIHSISRELKADLGYAKGMRTPLHAKLIAQADKQQRERAEKLKMFQPPSHTKSLFVPLPSTTVKQQCSAPILPPTPELPSHLQTYPINIPFVQELKLRADAAEQRLLPPATPAVLSSSPTSSLNSVTFATPSLTHSHSEPTLPSAPAALMPAEHEENKETALVLHSSASTALSPVRSISRLAQRSLFDVGLPRRLPPRGPPLIDTISLLQIFTDSNPHNLRMGIGLRQTIGTRAGLFFDEHALVTRQMRGRDVLSVCLKSFGALHPINYTKPQRLKLTRERSQILDEQKRKKKKKQIRKTTLVLPEERFEQDMNELAEMKGIDDEDYELESVSTYRSGSVAAAGAAASASSARRVSALSRSARLSNMGDQATQRSVAFALEGNDGSASSRSSVSNVTPTHRSTTRALTNRRVSVRLSTPNTDAGIDRRGTLKKTRTSIIANNNETEQSSTPPASAPFQPALLSFLARSSSSTSRPSSALQKQIEADEMERISKQVPVAFNFVTTYTEEDERQQSTQYHTPQYQSEQALISVEFQPTHFHSANHSRKPSAEVYMPQVHITSYTPTFSEQSSSSTAITPNAFDELPLPHGFSRQHTSSSMSSDPPLSSDVSYANSSSVLSHTHTPRSTISSHRSTSSVATSEQDDEDVQNKNDESAENMTSIEWTISDEEREEEESKYDESHDSNQLDATIAYQYALTPVPATDTTPTHSSSGTPLPAPDVNSSTPSTDDVQQPLVTSLSTDHVHTDADLGLFGQHTDEPINMNFPPLDSNVNSSRSTSSRSPSGHSHIPHKVVHFIDGELGSLPSSPIVSPSAHPHTLPPVRALKVVPSSFQVLSSIFSTERVITKSKSQPLLPLKPVDFSKFDDSSIVKPPQYSWLSDDATEQSNTQRSNDDAKSSPFDFNPLQLSSRSTSSHDASARPPRVLLSPVTAKHTYTPLSPSSSVMLPPSRSMLQSQLSDTFSFPTRPSSSKFSTSRASITMRGGTFDDAIQINIQAADSNNDDRSWARDSQRPSNGPSARDSQRSRVTSRADQTDSPLTSPFSTNADAAAASVPSPTASQSRRASNHPMSNFPLPQLKSNSRAFQRHRLSTISSFSLDSLGSSPVAPQRSINVSAVDMLRSPSHSDSNMSVHSVDEEPAHNSSNQQHTSSSSSLRHSRSLPSSSFIPFVAPAATPSFYVARSPDGKLVLQSSTTHYKSDSSPHKQHHVSERKEQEYRGDVLAHQARGVRRDMTELRKVKSTASIPFQSKGRAQNDQPIQYMSLVAQQQ